MGIEKTTYEPASCELVAQNDVASERTGERRDMADVAELIALRFTHRRLLLSIVDRNPDPAVLEALYAKQPHLRGSQMFEPKRCSFCGDRTDRTRFATVEGHNGACICGDCARVIVEGFDNGADE